MNTSERIACIRLYSRIALNRLRNCRQPAISVKFGRHPIRERSGFGLNEVIGIAAGIIIAVVIVIPGLQTFANNVLTQLTTWWNGMAADIFSN